MKAKILEVYQYHTDDFNIKIGDVLKILRIDGDDVYVESEKGYGVHFYNYMVQIGTNRQRLRTFLDQNKANKQRLSLALGKSKSWLSTMCYDSKREDIADETLDNIMSMLTIDWQSTKPLHVTTAGYVPYTTIPANYSRPQDKQRLLDAFFNGDVK